MSQQQSSSGSPLPEEIFKPVKTNGDGDCAFHALLGEWDPERKEFFHKEVKENRKKFKEAIIEGFREEEKFLRITVREAIKELIMEDDLRQVPHKGKLMGLAIQYEQFKQEEAKKLEKAQTNFESFLVHEEHTEFKKYIEESLPDSKANLWTQVHSIRQENKEELENRIKTLPKLYESYKSILSISEKKFDWIEKISTSAGIVEEYANIIGRPGKRLYFIELKLLAHVFNKTLIFRLTPTMAWEKLCEGDEPVVRIQPIKGKGGGYFERCILAAEAKKYGIESKSSTTSSSSSVSSEPGGEVDKPPTEVPKRTAEQEAEWEEYGEEIKRAIDSKDAEKVKALAGPTFSLKRNEWRYQEYAYFPKFLELEFFRKMYEMVDAHFCFYYCERLASEKRMGVGDEKEKFDKLFKNAREYLDNAAQDSDAKAKESAAQDSEDEARKYPKGAGAIKKFQEVVARQTTNISARDQFVLSKEEATTVSDLLSLKSWVKKIKEDSIEKYKKYICNKDAKEDHIPDNQKEDYLGNLRGIAESRLQEVMEMYWQVRYLQPFKGSRNLADLFTRTHKEFEAKDKAYNEQKERQRKLMSEIENEEKRLQAAYETHARQWISKSKIDNIKNKVNKNHYFLNSLRDSEGNTLIHYALKIHSELKARNESTDSTSVILGILLDRGCRPYIENDKEVNAFRYAPLFPKKSIEWKLMGKLFNGLVLYSNFSIELQEAIKEYIGINNSGWRKWFGFLYNSSLFEKRKEDVLELLAVLDRSSRQLSDQESFNLVIKKCDEIVKDHKKFTGALGGSQFLEILQSMRRYFYDHCQKGRNATFFGNIDPEKKEENHDLVKLAQREEEKRKQEDEKRKQFEEKMNQREEKMNQQAEKINQQAEQMKQYAAMMMQFAQNPAASNRPPSSHQEHNMFVGRPAVSETPSANVPAVTLSSSITPAETSQ